MGPAIDDVTINEFKLFYGIDRDLYTVLVRDLYRNPSECMQIMGFWLWFERRGICNIVGKILSLTLHLIDQLAEEALICLKLVNNQFQIPISEVEIPLTRFLIHSEISLQFFHENQRTVYHAVQNLVSDVYIPALSDIMERARNGSFDDGPSRSSLRVPGHTSSGSFGENSTYRQMRIPVQEAPGAFRETRTHSRMIIPTHAASGAFGESSTNSQMIMPAHAASGAFGESSTNSQMIMPAHVASCKPTSRAGIPPTVDSIGQNFSKMNLGGNLSRPPCRATGNETSRYSRTMFATFSKGYPVTENEVGEYFTMLFGNCIESLHMQDVRPDEQALYARIVFHKPCLLRIILNGANKTKFTINGKHVWMRRFIPRG